MRSTRKLAAVGGALCVLIIGLELIGMYGRYGVRIKGAQLIQAVQRNDADRVAYLLTHRVRASANARVRVPMGFAEYLLAYFTHRISPVGPYALDIATRMRPPLNERLPLEKQASGHWYRDNARIVNLLMDHGARARGYRSRGPVDSEVACALDESLTLEALLRHGARADTSAWGPPFGDITLEMAVSTPGRSVKDIVELIHAGASVDPVSPLGVQALPLPAAVNKRRLDLAHTLLNYGADPTAGQSNAIQNLAYELEFQPGNVAFARDALELLAEMHRVAAAKSWSVQAHEHSSATPTPPRATGVKF